MEIAPEIVEEIEERREYERIMWRRNARLARDQREAEELEARAREEELYPVVRATMGAVGDGRERKQVRLVFNLTSPKLNIFLLVGLLSLRWRDGMLG